MSENISVIQMTEYEHGRKRGLTIDAELSLLKLTSAMTAAELAAYEMAAYKFWNYATDSILRDGKARFERED